MDKELSNYLNDKFYANSVSFFYKQSQKLSKIIQQPLSKQHSVLKICSAIDAWCNNCLEQVILKRFQTRPNIRFIYNANHGYIDHIHHALVSENRLRDIDGLANKKEFAIKTTQSEYQSETAHTVIYTVVWRDKICVNMFVKFGSRVYARLTAKPKW